MERSASLKKEKMTTTQMTVTALMTAVLCIFGPMVLPIPVSPVPISLTNLVLYFMVYILGMKASLMSFCLYLLLGACLLYTSVAEVIIAKQRNGPIGTVNLGWRPELTRFVNMAKEQ